VGTAERCSVRGKVVHEDAHSLCDCGEGMSHETRDRAWLGSAEHNAQATVADFDASPVAALSPP
jgi:hypothetical protein